MRKFNVETAIAAFESFLTMRRLSRNRFRGPAVGAVHPTQVQRRKLESRTRSRCTIQCRL